MKKYILLVILGCATFALGAFVFSSAHTNSVISSELNNGNIEQVEMQVAEEIIEKNSTKDAIIEVGKSTTKHIAEYFFSIIYK